ncbi:helix-turn-helix domain-containing protein [Streptomyces specialis]|uniref:helix-turn-helix domain-containing protein n=1 Tax=Streptomyces specialis TaxID=498367 RepID=UPI00073F5E86|nr:helix-turn-helix transcriptional regulator [Streptomyces specialis]
MPESSDEYTGARIAELRARRGLTQTGLAMRAHVSMSLLSKVECGQRPASPAFVAACARGLGVPVAELLGQPYADELRRDRLDVLLQPIRVGMENWDVPHDWTTPPRHPSLIGRDVRRLLLQRRHAEYTPMLRDLPGVIDECVHAVHTSTGEDRRYAYECLANAFRCVFTVAWNFGYQDLATVALDRIALAAPQADEPGLLAVQAYLRAQTVLAHGRYDIGLRVVQRALTDLEGQDSRRPEGLDALRGSLHLRAAVIAGRAKDRARADSHLAVARSLAEETGELPDYGLTWGPPNVGVHAVAVVSELEEYDEAIQLAGDVRIPRGWSRSRAGHHWMDVARIHAWAGSRTEALTCLQRARRAAPQQTKYHPTTRETVIQLRRREHSRTGPLARFAAWIGVT